MAITYKIVERVNSIEESAPVKFYALTKCSGEITLRELVNDITDLSSLSAGDVMSVLEQFIKLVPKHLSKGHIVRLGDFGSFYTTANSEGVEVEADFDESLIKKTNIKFRAGHEVKNVLSNVKYKKYTIN